MNGTGISAPSGPFGRQWLEYWDRMAGGHNERRSICWASSYGTAHRILGYQSDEKTIVQLAHDRLESG